MSAKKERITITVDQAMIEAANEVVASGRADSLSALVNRALGDHLERERRRAGLLDVIAEWEAKHGAISDADLTARIKADRRNAILVRGRKSPTRKPRRPKAA